MPTKVKVRAAKGTDAEAILIVQRMAVLGISESFYDRRTLETWAKTADEPSVVAQAELIGISNESWVVATIDKRVVGFGWLVPETLEIRAVYVHPSQQRQGIGSEILRHMEDIAVDQHLPHLDAEASKNSVEFYASQGIQNLGQSEQVLWSGITVPCVKMRKAIF